MKKHFLILSTTTLIFTLLFTACKSKKTNTIGRYIPTNASMIFHLDGESMVSKMPWEDMKKNTAFLEMYKDTSISNFTKTIMDNPENSGVNVKGDLVAFSVKDSINSYFSIQGKITDEAKFKKLLVEANKNATETTKDGYTFSVSENASVAYNKDRFIATMPDKTTGIGTIGVDSAVMAEPVVDLNKINETIIALAEDKSMAKNDKFSKLLTEKGDAHFWIDAKNLNNGLENNPAMAALAGMNKLIEGAVTTGTINFENGKINIDAKSYGGAELTDLYKKYNGDNFNKEMINNIPSKNLAAVFTFNFKPEGIKAFLKLLALDGVVNIGTAQYGFTLDDFIKGNKGDIMIAVTDLKAGVSALDFSTNYIFAASINDKPSFNKLVDAGRKAGAPFGKAMPALEKINFNANDKYFALSSNQAFTDGYLAGKANSNFDFISKIPNGSMAGFVNLQYVLANTNSSTTDTLSLQEHNLNMKMWDNVIISGGNFKDDGLTQHWEINMMDKNTNSLKQLNTYSDEMSKINIKKTALQSTAWKNEDVLAPVAKKNK